MQDHEIDQSKHTSIRINKEYGLPCAGAPAASVTASEMMCSLKSLIIKLINIQRWNWFTDSLVKITHELL